MVVRKSAVGLSVIFLLKCTSVCQVRARVIALSPVFSSFGCVDVRSYPVGDVLAG